MNKYVDIPVTKFLQIKWRYQAKSKTTSNDRKRRALGEQTYPDPNPDVDEFVVEEEVAAAATATSMSCCPSVVMIGFNWLLALLFLDAPPLEVLLLEPLLLPDDFAFCIAAPRLPVIMSWLRPCIVKNLYKPVNWSTETRH